jgi:hypothetical protein
MHNIKLHITVGILTCSLATLLDAPHIIHAFALSAILVPQVLQYTKLSFLLLLVNFYNLWLMLIKILAVGLKDNKKVDI